MITLLAPSQAFQMNSNNISSLCSFQTNCFIMVHVTDMEHVILMELQHSQSAVGYRSDFPVWIQHNVLTGINSLICNN